ncbi:MULTISPECIES: hypothetical protein [Asaia]|uniref:Uncharacterized protein n=1 Tax=Asaia bogorensis TaxID=91915 RepID=A0A060QGF9_9PROT|nr:MULTISPECIES: hypothetical protein [Asaia]ETC98275.1 hypothetical protein P792_11190 [Asaia sp. SF2.1]MDL2171681.1 hypothetical protein [Asaia sp. HumB]CDG40189.1 hypothetical protein ASAP_2144 [Asaia bogorensis]
MKALVTLPVAVLVYLALGNATYHYFAWSGRSWKILSPVFYVNDALALGLSQASIIMTTMMLVSLILAYVIVTGLGALMSRRKA